MIVTIGGRATRSSSESSNVSGSISSSAACLIVISRLSLRADDLDLLVGERLGRCPHLAEVHQDLDELRHRDAERLREVLDDDARLDGDRPARRRSRRLLLARRRLCAPVARLPPVSPTCSSTLDHDPPLAASWTAARADRAIRSVSAVSHRRSAYSSSFAGSASGATAIAASSSGSSAASSASPFASADATAAATSPWAGGAVASA